MKNLLVMALVVALVIPVVGCVVYSDQKYGPQNFGSAKTMEEALTRAGGPKQVHKVGNTTICVYDYIEGVNILGVYGNVKKKDRVLVFDDRGALTGDYVVDKGQGMFVLGFMSPVMEME